MVLLLSQLEFDRAITHRNIPCDVYLKKIPLPNTDITIHFEVFIPTSGVQFNGVQTTYFSVQLIAVNNKQPDEKNKLTFMIDFFNIESFDGDGVKFDRLLDDFNLPLGRGCSQYVVQMQPTITSQSFSLKYEQQSRGESILMAYDHIGGYLRREISGGSTSIWDINENLLYHIDQATVGTFKTATTYPDEMQICSVMDVTDARLNSALRPYMISSRSLDVLKMIGASDVGYLGRGKVRDLPCLIFESIVSEPPVIFGLTENQLNKDKTNTREYIVQFHVLEGKRSYQNSQPLLAENGFWPARIVLMRRKLDLSTVEVVDQLEIFDFYWSLDGWDKKSTKLFMASECFDDEDEQIRLGTAITFDRVHDASVKKWEDMILLPSNKFKLEFDLINNLFNLFQISRLHLIEYSLKLRPNHVNLNMLIGDRKEDKRLVFYGEGQLPEPSSYETNRIVLSGHSEISCVLTCSHMEDVSLVLYCPQGLLPSGDSFCIAVYDENEPTITKANNRDANTPMCQVYRFEESKIANKGVDVIHDKAGQLYLQPIEFVARAPGVAGKTELLKGSIKNFEVSQETQLITLNRYMFVVDTNKPPSTDQNNDIKTGHSTNRNQKVRSFTSITYRSVEDCARMCGLDVDCRSYSYCSDKNQNSERCILSSLDIRSSKVQEQLVKSKLNDESRIEVNSLSDGQKYALKLESGCNIYEHDYLNLFRQTDEVIRFNAEIANQFQRAPTTFECAKQSIDLESSSPEHHVAMFAYCAASNTCLLDENLFAITNKYDQNDNESKETDKDRERESNELVCRVYRKKYQTFFTLSADVMKRNEKQIEFAFNNVEDCARACWMRLGQICASFDYCTPGVCLVNQKNMKDAAGEELETRQSCLHYERDLNLDELRKKHMIGRHEMLADSSDSSDGGMSVGRFFQNIFTYSLVVCAFMYGLVLGRQVNDKMDSLSILRQSVSAGPGVGSSQLFGIPTSLSESCENNQDENNCGEGWNDDEAGGSNAIRMDVIKSGSADKELLKQDF